MYYTITLERPARGHGDEQDLEVHVEPRNLVGIVFVKGPFGIAFGGIHGIDRGPAQAERASAAKDSTTLSPASPRENAATRAWQKSGG
jgi:hypothetical protein